jgi:hypothetical protein
MKTIVLFFILTISQFSFSQSNSDVIKYSANTLEITLYDSSNKIINEKIIGKNVIVDYDKIFKSYKVQYENEDGEIKIYKFTFIKNLGGNLNLMKTPEGTEVKIIDEMQDGGLLIQTPTTKEGTTLYFSTSRTTRTD